MAAHHEELNVVAAERDSDEENIDEEDENWEDWNSENDEENENFNNSEMLCLFCDFLYRSSDSLFQHCAAAHHFDFHAIKNTHGLDFYGCLKLINYIRTQVLQKRCWCCGVNCESKKELQLHLHEADASNNSIFPWDDDKYLRPLMEDDPLLYSFGDNVECEDDDVISVDEEELQRDIGSFGRVFIDNKCETEQFSSELRIPLENGDGVASLERGMSSADCLEKLTGMGLVDVEADSTSCRKLKDEQLRFSSVKVAANEIKARNKSYFGSYSSFGIHREMISDKVRTDAYRQAILENPSLLRGAIVMDIGCGTGILSLFASQAGATRVIAVEASHKMASVAAQIAKDNGLLWSERTDEDKNCCTGVIEVVQSMVEELDNNAKNIEPHSMDVLVSEWMGYCLLYESMLSSVLFARDKWLKPGGAILPDTATMFVAGFGRGGTCLPFWENVYGFNMSCIGKEVVEDAAQLPLVDVIDDCDIVTTTEVLQAFDLVTMKYEEMDFTSKVELAPKMDTLNCDTELKAKSLSCHGLVLWFETGFTQRFCKEMPTTLSTSPYTTRTHWSQTILTFKEPIVMALGKQVDDQPRQVGTDACPALRIQSRISIARGVQHRSIDISMELLAIGPGGRKRNLPVQMFNLQ